MKTVLSGLKPTGEMTIGNYLGAMKHWPLNQGDNRSIFFVPNTHALTARQDPIELKKRTLDLVAWLLAVGVDPDKSIILVQSMVPAHAELFWILDNFVTMGELHRMTQFKDKTKKTSPEGQLVGFFNYPVLMAADILLYDTNEVPVGDDQAQHVELARNIATRFNNIYGETFILPKAVVPSHGARVKRLDDPRYKMSKSDRPDSYVALGENAESVVKKFKRAVTDSDTTIIYDPKNKPAIANLMEIYAGFADIDIANVEKIFATKGYGEFKQVLGELVAQKLATLQLEFEKYRSNEEKLMSIIEQGNTKASQIANKKLAEVKIKVGLL
ncbi:tryptophan--tRNA ligase [Candidatus Saccharibacteria bacterium]|nr:tryptophan--tRNA ligase [Candidatus Saccharibacteria bacterium]